MSNVVRIDVEGVNVNADGSVSAASVEGAINERVTATFTMQGTTGPSIDDEVEFYTQDGTTVFYGGLVVDVRCVGVSDNNPTQNVYEVDVVNWERFTDWCSLTLDYDVPVALEDVLADMITEAFGDYGLSYTPTATGVMLAPFSWVAKPGNECVRELRDRTNLIIRFNADKSITTVVPGAAPGLFAITDANLYRLSKFDVNTKGRELANRVVLTFGPTGPGESITHTWIADGVATSFSLEGLNVRASDVWPGIVTVDGTPYPIWPPGDGPADGITWAHRVDDGTLTFNGSFASLVTAGVEIELRYAPLYPFVITRETGATPPREYRASNASILRYDVGVEVADQVLARTSQAADARVVELVTDEIGFDIGQALTVNTTARGGVVADFLVATVQIELVNAELWVTTLTATEGDQPQITYQGEWEQVTSGGGGSGGGQSVVVSVSGEGVAWTNIGATSWGVGTGFWREYNAGNPRLRIGTVAGNRLQFETATGGLTVVSERLTIDDAGVLIAPDGTARAELSGFRFGDGYGLYATETSVGNVRDLELVCEAEGIAGSGTPRLILKAKETDGGGETSITLTKTGIVFAGGPVTLTPATAVHGAVAYSTATQLAYTAAGTSGQILRSAGAAAPTWSTATYPATAATSGAYLRADGTNWITSTLILPNAITANQLVYGSATNTYGASANLTYDGTSLSVLNAAGTFVINPSFGETTNTYAAGDAVGATLTFIKKRGTIASPAIVQSGDVLALIKAVGATGAATQSQAGTISIEVDGTPGVTDMPGRIVFKTSSDGSGTPSERGRFTSTGNLKIAGTATRGTTEGTNHLDIFNGTAPVGTLTNGISLYATSGELRVMDAAGNATLLSPHDKRTNYWIYDSVHSVTGARLRIDVEQLLRRLNAVFGWDFVHDLAA